MFREQPVRMTTLARIGWECRMGRTRASRLEVGPPLPMRQDHQVLAPELGMTIGAELRPMAPRAGLGIIVRLDGVDLPPVRAVGTGHRVQIRVLGLQVGIDAAAGVAIEAEAL